MFNYESLIDIKIKEIQKKHKFNKILNFFELPFKTQKAIVNKLLIEDELKNEALNLIIPLLYFNHRTSISSFSKNFIP